EEWALEKIIERSFYNSEDYQNFFQNIGSSLPIRRAFRNWLSEKLLNNKEAVKSFIENTIYDDEIESYWKDEILISVLLSDYAGVFFQLFENKLLEDNQKLLIKIVFLLRTACKEIDEALLKQFGLKRNFILNTIFTKPKGSGWHCVIDFIHKHKNDFGLQHINIILPLLNDWNNKNKQGDATKKSSQIALFYYDEITKNGGFSYNYRNEKKELLIRPILQGASEITEELKVVFDEIISENQTNHTDKYYELAKTILTSIIDSFEVVKSLPNYVVKLADIFWFQPKKEGYYSIGVEKYFGISSSHDFHYFPASALQTPIFQLLRFARKETFDFILSFINKAVEYYTQSEYKNQIKEVEIFIEGEEPIKQYICTTLWEIYRQGTIHLLESIHMALEKWLLENAETTPKEILESWCLYLIRNSKSASITSVVTSIVLAQPSKLFNIAKILFQTKEFFCYDTSRYISDQSTKSLYSIGYDLNSQNKLFQDERIKTCEQSHRKLALEHIALKYQLFRSEDETEEEVTERQKIIWAIFDKYYEKLREKSIETDADKIWRLYLARMDRRKMSPEVEEKDGEFLIKFNPELDPELKKHSEDSSKEYSDRMRYIPLKLWSNYRFEGEKDKYQQYQKYENDPQLVITETQEMLEEMKKKTDIFFLFNDSTPAYTCSVLVRDFFDRLNSDEKEFCKEVIIEYASRPLPFRTEHYHYQISDGTEPTITILSVLLNHFPQDKENIKWLLLLLLFNRETAKFATFSIANSLWKTNFEDAHAIFLGYLSLKVKYDLLRQEVRIESYKKNIDEHSELQILESFIEKYENEFERIISNKITYYELDNLEKLDLEILTRAFELLPMQTDHEDHKKFLNVIFPVFSKEFFQDSKKTFQHNDMIDYTLKNRFLEKYSYFILNSKQIEIKTYLKPFVDNFSDTENMAEFFQKFVFMEDRLNKYEEFWIVWNAFYERIAVICKHNISYRYSKGIIHNYLLAWQYWREDAKDWHTLKDREKVFFKKVAEDIGHHPSVLYSISKILNDIASNFIDDGISWISKMIQKNKYISIDLEINTIYYIENLIRR
ncbi:MAG TPA: ATPase, partial [Flavobacterium sp.]|nr:ATPase [Flavobacterium sp.]